MNMFAKQTRLSDSRKESLLPFSKETVQGSNGQKLIPKTSGVLLTDMIKLIKSNKHKDGRYGKLITIISNPIILLYAYLAIKGNHGNITTAGFNKEIVEGINMNFFYRLSQDLNQGKFNFTRAQRITIPKANKMELSMDILSQKIVQKAIQQVLIVIYEEKFIDCSHGFRTDVVQPLDPVRLCVPSRGPVQRKGHAGLVRFEKQQAFKQDVPVSFGFGEELMCLAPLRVQRKHVNSSCHTALKTIKLLNADNYSWAIKGEISQFFDTIQHDTLIQILGRVINCPATLNLIRKALIFGYVDVANTCGPVRRKGHTGTCLRSPKTSQTRKLIKSNVGISQGGILSPLFGNIILHELDKFITETLQKEYNTSKSPTLSSCPIFRKGVKMPPTIDYMAPDVFEEQGRANFKRIQYIRYADQWLILMAGSFADTTHIKHRVVEFIKDKLKLTLSDEKIKITNLRKSKLHFLDVDIHIRKITNANVKDPTIFLCGKKVLKIRKNSDMLPREALFFEKDRERFILQAPIKELIDKLITLGFAKRNRVGKVFPCGYTPSINKHHADILRFYNSKIRDILNYYTCVHNRTSLWSIVSILQRSCAITLARKFKLGQGTARSAFVKFGKYLTCVLPDRRSKVKLFIPDNLRMLPMNSRFYSSADI